MHTSLSVISRNTSEVITVEQAKTWLHVTGNSEDSLIQNMIDGAVMYAENFLNRSISQNTYALSITNFSDLVELRLPPVSEVTKIEYFDSEGATQEFDLAKVRVNKEEGYLFLKESEEWPDDVADEYFPIRIEYSSLGLIKENAGADILDAIKLTIAYRYDLRDDPNQRWRKASDNILYPLRLQNF
jgi:uncharacterized phiE125 gp8 family phage protein